ncbi:GGDEF domain-containing protein [Marinobacter adhaerens]|uniref:GGDEF domain-containing protein n=1 Tax=Marinobacter adhaerens TaxID=1033846 RepID=UPI001E3D2660|nr:GGDEF domain-containing protein [Marinobacter adhaerens]MCD1647273.1 GGDEF domain-containing protein [Marinobacter adhaerens]
MLNQHIAPRIFQQFMARSRDGYALFDNNDTLIYCNATYGALIGSTPENLQGSSFAKIRGFLGEVKISEVNLLDGRWFMSSENRLDEGWLIHRLVDITQQKRSERDLESTVKQLRDLSITDELTRVFNRRGFVAHVEDELKLHRDNGMTISMGLLDLDRFKSVNDTYGHAIGDMALKHAAQIIRNTIRDTDSVGRMGGEEFAIFLGNTSIVTAHEVLNRIRIALENTPLILESGPLHLTASIGLTCLSHQTTFEALLSEADSALYAAKGNGRNRVELSDGLEAQPA